MVALFVHAWVGVRNILMDYAKPMSVRLTLQVVVICVLIAYAGWTIQVLWG
jgi:succinate dehydrogenase / fumarate reductase membrane anchor subunit